MREFCGRLYVMLQSACALLYIKPMHFYNMPNITLKSSYLSCTADKPACFVDILLCILYQPFDLSIC
jgi:hypothetical protein